MRLEAVGLWDELVLPRFDAMYDAEVHPRADHRFRRWYRARCCWFTAIRWPCSAPGAHAGDPHPQCRRGRCRRHSRSHARRASPPWRTRSDVALLFGDQTRSVGQFSRLRHRIDFSTEARQLSLARMISGPMVDMNFSATLGLWCRARSCRSCVDRVFDISTCASRLNSLYPPVLRARNGRLGRGCLSSCHRRATSRSRPYSYAAVRSASNANAVSTRSPRIGMPRY